MKKIVTLAEARRIYGETTYETESNFLVNKFGKYQPNITFVIPKSFDLGKDGSVINPIGYISDREVTDNMNINFDGDASFIFGDFWRSKKGGACFRPKNPLHAKHLLIRISWGGCFNRHRGVSAEYAEECNALYYRGAMSNGGGAGNDYLVFPVGYKKSGYDPEFDGENNLSHQNQEVEVQSYREKHAKLHYAKVEEADKFLKEKALAEAESRKAKEYFMDRLESIKERLIPVDLFFDENNIGKQDFEMFDSYFKIGIVTYLYTEENVQKAEQWISRQEQFVSDRKVEQSRKAAAKAEFGPRFSALEDRFAKIGWRIDISSSEKAKIIEPYDRYWNCTTYHEEKIHEFSYNWDSFDTCVKMLESKETEIRERREAEEIAKRTKEMREAAKALGLPSDIRLWHRSGSTNEGKAWVIDKDGMERDCDFIDTTVCKSNSKRYHQSYEGNHVWEQILPGELVIYWSHEYTAAPHNFKVIYKPEKLSEAQLERVAEIQEDIESAFYGKTGLTGTRSCPSIGQGWGLFKRQ